MKEVIKGGHVENDTTGTKRNPKYKKAKLTVGGLLASEGSVYGVKPISFEKLASTEGNND